MAPESEAATEERPDVTAEQPASPAGPAPVDDIPVRPALGGAAPTHPDVALDDESPLELEKTFAILCALGGVMCLVPRQWWSAVVLFSLAALSLVLFLVRRRAARG